MRIRRPTVEAAAVAATVGLQLLALPLSDGGLSIVVAVPVVVVLGIQRVAAQLTRRRLGIVLALGAWCAVATAVSGRGPDASLPSLALLLYVLSVFAFPAPLRQDRILRAFYRAGVVIAGLATVQLVAQFVGLGQPNLATLLPSDWLVSGYNTTPPWSFGSDLIRSNGMVCIEPSIASQYIGLALVIGAVTHRLRPGALVVLALGGAATVSGTGMLVAACALPALLRGRLRWRAVVSLGAVATVAVAAGLADAVLDRAQNLFESSNSGGARFVLPFRIAAATAGDASTFLFGLGPGAGVRGAREQLGFAEVGDSMFSVPVKLTLEYGVPAAVLGVALFLRVALRTLSPRSLAVAALLVMLALNSGPVEPAAFVVFWLLTSRRAPAPLRSHERPAAVAVDAR